MAITSEGTIEIPIEEFWNFVESYALQGVENAFGKPIVNLENGTIDINFAHSTDSNPYDWKEKPSCLKEWENK